MYSFNPIAVPFSSGRRFRHPVKSRIMTHTAFPSGYTFLRSIDTTGNPSLGRRTMLFLRLRIIRHTAGGESSFCWDTEEEETVSEGQWFVCWP